MLPPIFAVTIAYIGDEWPRAGSDHRRRRLYSRARASAASADGSSPALFADLIGWRDGFVALAGDRLRRRDRGRAVAAARAEIRAFGRTAGVRAADAARISATAQLLATYAVGFGVLFNFIATFTYRQLSSRRPALQSLRHLARRDFRRLSRRLRAHAVDRLGGRPVRAAPLHDRRIALWIVGICLDAGAARCRSIMLGLAIMRRLRADLPGDLDRLCDDHRARPAARRRSGSM